MMPIWHGSAVAAECSPAPSVVGFHGKLPGIGDFARRRLSDALVQAWDAHASQQLARHPQLAEAQGDGWCFAFAAGLCGVQGWAGVAAPSRDRVGRAFPLLLALPLAADDPVQAPQLPSARWLDALLALQVQVTQGGMHLPDMLDNACHDLPPAWPGQVGPLAWQACWAQRGSLWWRDARPPCVLPGLPADDLLLRAVHASCAPGQHTP
ncbi:type VI secretion system-associated protein TagF [Stenotrophomonas maltophilia]|nr:type VI secretion system-associated protein TagF [Stenotrophomonas maltophilia]